MKRMTSRVLIGVLLLLLAAGCERRESMPAEESEEPSSSAPSFQEPESHSEELFVPSSSQQEELSPLAQDVEATAKTLFASMKSGAIEIVEQHLDYDAFLQLAEGQSDDNFRALLGRMDYEIQSVDANGDTGLVNVTLSNIDMSMALGSYLREAMDLEYNNAMAESPLSQAELEARYGEMFTEALDQNSHHRIEETLLITFIRTDDVWQAQISESFQNAALGNYFPAKAQLGNNAGGGQ